MLDIKLIRENPDAVKKGLDKKHARVDLDQVIALDSKRRTILALVEKLKSDKNRSSAEISKMNKAGTDVTRAIEDSRRLSEEIRTHQENLNVIETDLKLQMLLIPNLPHESVPEGAGAAENKVARTWGEKPHYEFKIRDHLEIGESLGLFSFSWGSKISGRGFPVYIGSGARLERALINFFLDTQIKRNGFTEIIPPLLVNRKTMTGTGQLPKMENDMYRMEEDDLFLIPTAEVPVTNLHADDVIPAERLPISYAAYTPCFRREAGSWGKDTRGFQRLHQFDKVEMVKFVSPESSYQVLEELVGYAEHLLQDLGLHYRVLELCAGDLSFAAARCYDLEVYSPAGDAWLEVSSVSNFEAFQARRANIKMKTKGKPQFVHTLNGSGLATPRVLVALLETFQTASGTVRIPECLRPYMDGLEEIKP